MAIDHLLSESNLHGVRVWFVGLMARVCILFPTGGAYTGGGIQNLLDQLMLP